MLHFLTSTRYNKDANNTTRVIWPASQKMYKTIYAKNKHGIKCRLSMKSDNVSMKIYIISKMEECLLDLRCNEEHYMAFLRSVAR